MLQISFSIIILHNDCKTKFPSGRIRSSMIQAPHVRGRLYKCETEERKRNRRQSKTRRVKQKKVDQNF